MENRAEKVSLFMRDNMGFFIIFIVLAIWIIKGLTTLDETGKTVEQIIGDGLLAAILGYSVCRTFEKQGFIAGKKDKRMKDVRERHGRLVEEVSPDLDYLDPYCEERTAGALKDKRAKILRDQGMKYSTFFDDFGNVIESAYKIPRDKDKELEARNRAKRKALKSAINAKVTALTSNSLTGESGIEYDPFYFGQTQKQFIRKSAGWDLIYKLITGGIFGYYGVKMLTNPDWGYIIWTSVQAAAFLVSGGLKYLSAYLFIIEDTIDGIVKKMDNLQKFKNIDKTKYKEANKHAAIGTV